MTKIRTALALALTSLALTACADVESAGDDFGLSQDFSYGETGDEWGGEDGGDADGGAPSAFEPHDDVPVAECGNGVVEAGELCDDGELNGDDQGCTSACQFNVCGDGLVLDGIEECDDGRLNGIDGGGAYCDDMCNFVGPQ